MTQWTDASHRPVLVITGDGDVTTDFVVLELEKRGVPLFRFDTAEFPLQINFEAHLIDGKWTTHLERKGDRICLDSVQGVYYRRPNGFQLPKWMSDAEWEFAYAEAQGGIGGVLGSLECRWVNHPHAELLADPKAQQLVIASQCGLTTPRTLITNKADAVREFFKSFPGPMICKAIDMPGFIENGQELSIFTTIVTPEELDRLPGIELTAHKFQEFVPKKYEVRATVVNNEFFAVAIRTKSTSNQVDWRVDFRSNDIEVIQLPKAIQLGLSKYLSYFGLSFGAFDFVVTPDDEWVFLECNPSGQWAWIEPLAQPIAKAIADYLAQPQA